MCFLRLSFFLCIVCLISCAGETHYAPVMEIDSIDPVPKTGMHHADDGETLYEIAWRYGLDYRNLTSANHLTPSQSLKSGQTIYLKNKKIVATKQKSIQHFFSPHFPRNKKLIEPQYVITAWLPPTNGKVIEPFSATHKGINIAGKLGQSIVASASGKVVYSGNGIRGYGNLIIIKHNNLYLSAYAHNNKLLVKEGDWVKEGRKIAEMGSTGTNRVMLHFEIRRAGVPIDPGSLFSEWVSQQVREERGNAILKFLLRESYA